MKISAMHSVNGGREYIEKNCPDLINIIREIFKNILNAIGWKSENVGSLESFF